MFTGAFDLMCHTDWGMIEGTQYDGIREFIQIVRVYPVLHEPLNQLGPPSKKKNSLPTCQESSSIRSVSVQRKDRRSCL